MGLCSSYGWFKTIIIAPYLAHIRLIGYQCEISIVSHYISSYYLIVSHSSCPLIPNTYGSYSIWPLYPHKRAGEVDYIPLNKKYVVNAQLYPIIGSYRGSIMTTMILWLGPLRTLILRLMNIPVLQWSSCWHFIPSCIRSIPRYIFMLCIIAMANDTKDDQTIVTYDL